LQRKTDDNKIIIACDFTGADWDEVAPMIEGHHGSVLSLAALDLAIDGAADADAKFQCTMCLRYFDPPAKCWRHPDPPDQANPDAVICWDCIQQADRAFARDPDTDWDRKIPPDRTWK